MDQHHELAEAIRNGAKLRPQARTSFFARQDDGALASCVLGAAYEGVSGRTDTTLRFSRWVKKFPEMEGDRGVCPVVDCYDHYSDQPGDFTTNIMTHLNDYHRWTREAIADWLDTL